MITEARDAIRAALRDGYPPGALPTIHIRTVPAAFTRPAYYLRPLPVRGVEIASELRNYPMTWQLVYFPLEDEASNPNMDDVYAAMERLESIFGTVRSLTGPSGEVFHMDAFSSDYRDDVVYCSIDLQTMRRRIPAPATLMGTAAVSIETKKE